MGEFVHSKQARFDQSHVSCGVMEVHHLPDKTASNTLFSILNALYHKANPRPSAFVIWSDVITEPTTRGQQLAKHLVPLGLGEVVGSGRAINPKTGNLIALWVWRIDHEKARKFYQDELANRIDVE